MKFVDRIANYIIENDLPFEDLTIVLPSGRAKKYVQRALTKHFDKPFFSPNIVTIDKWVVAHSSFKVIDKLDSLFLLYQVHLGIIDPEEDASFDAFYSWAQMLLSDFEEIEKYLVDSKDLFKNLRDIREIEKWSPNNEELTEAQEKYLQFWDRLKTYYKNFRTVLEKDNLAYRGLCYREIAENIDLLFQSNKKAHFVFAGFNALSKAEMTIMKQLNQMGRGHILLNSDKFYLDAKHHEAGVFHRSLLKFLGKKELPFVENDLSTTNKNIRVVECAQQVGQVNVASTLLATMSSEEINKTLLLLADESLVGPMIKNLPLNVGQANITMGLELRNTSIRLWVDILFSIQENQKRFNTSALYHKDIFRIWQHPFFQAMVDQEHLNQQRELEANIIRKNKLFLNIETLALGHAGLLTFLQWMTHPWNEDWHRALKAIRQINQIIYPFFQDNWTFEKALVKAFDKTIVQFQNALNQPLPEMTLKTFKLIFQQQYGKQSIAYEGNPIEGLQIMGLLETRLLDFDNIICLGLNEGKMPPSNPIQTLIPMDLRMNVGMPTTRDKQGLFAQHFYRLLHKAQNMTITYSTLQDGINGDEPSRYLLQLEKEWVREMHENKNQQVQFTKEMYVLEAKTSSQTFSGLDKTPAVLEKMDRLFARSMSTSALNKFIYCPMDFYFRYILEYGEEDEIEEELNQSSFGSIIHQALENLYRDFAHFDAKGEKNPKARPILLPDLIKMEAAFPTEIHKGFMDHYDGDESSFTTGKNYLSYQMALRLTKKFFTKEKNYLLKQPDGIRIHSLEQNRKVELELEVWGEKKKVTLSGIIDRIDYVGDSLRIVDYKSGKVSTEQVQLPTKSTSVEDALYAAISNKDSKYKHVLQLAVYGYLMKNTLNYTPANIELISFINYPENGLGLNTQDYRMDEVIDALPIALSRLLEQMYDVDQPFVHIDHQFSYCKYCQ